MALNYKIKDMKVGDTREYLGKTYRAERARPKEGPCSDCTGCDLFAKNPPICAPSDAFLGRCTQHFRKDKTAIIFKLVTAFILLFCLASCSTPRYSRTVSRIFDADGKLVQTTIIDNIWQKDSYPQSTHESLRNLHMEKGK